MYNIISNLRTGYGVKTVVADTVADLESIPVDTFTTGSSAFVFETEQNYLLSSYKKWVPVTPSQNNSSASDQSEKSDYTIVDGGGAQGL